MKNSLKFIVDAQLPKSLADWLKLRSLDAIHTLELPKQNKTSDEEILEIAQLENRIVISKDSDFLQSYILQGKPEKLILIITGNIRNTDLIEIIEKNFEKIADSITKFNVLEINRETIIIH